MSDAVVLSQAVSDMPATDARAGSVNGANASSPSGNTKKNHGFADVFSKTLDEKHKPVKTTEKQKAQSNKNPGLSSSAPQHINNKPPPPDTPTNDPGQHTSVAAEQPGPSTHQHGNGLPQTGSEPVSKPVLADTLQDALTMAGQPTEVPPTTAVIAGEDFNKSIGHAIPEAANVIQDGIVSEYPVSPMALSSGQKSAQLLDKPDNLALSQSATSPGLMQNPLGLHNGISGIAKESAAATVASTEALNNHIQSGRDAAQSLTPAQLRDYLQNLQRGAPGEHKLTVAREALQEGGPADLKVLEDQVLKQKIANLLNAREHSTSTASDARQLTSHAIYDKLFSQPAMTGDRAQALASMLKTSTGSLTAEVLANDPRSAEDSADAADNASTLRTTATGFRPVNPTAPAMMPLFQVASHVSQPGWSQEMGQKMLFMANQGIQQAQLQLNPKHLGPMEVRISVGQDQQVNVMFTAQHAQVRDALDGAVHRLREMLEQQGFNLNDFDVSEESFNQQREQARQGRPDRIEPADMAPLDDVVRSGEPITDNKVLISSDNLIDYFA